MIEIKHLKLIDTIAREGSLSKAAVALCLSPSALSHQLKELERMLGSPLFYRVNKQLHFTPSGKEFRDAGSVILDQMQALEQKVEEINQDQLRAYIHGYSQEEQQRLQDQAAIFANLLHQDSYWPEGAQVLEVGCGVGAQTRIICPQNPGSQFVSIDISSKSLAQARATCEQLGIDNVTFQEADVYSMPFESGSVDHVFVCFLLEHLSDVPKALQELIRVLKKGGSLTVIEGDHGSAYFYPDSTAAQKVVDAQVKLQRQQGGDPTIGRTLYPLLSAAGLRDVTVEPRQIYVDDSNPHLIEGFINNTFTAMIKGITEEAIARQILTKGEMERGLADLRKTGEGGGSFCYTFFRASATKG